MIRPLDAKAQLPIVLGNVRSTRNWRPRDMVNWHRMVSPLRALEPPPGASMDIFHLIFDVCTNFEVRYEPVARPEAAPPPAAPATRGRPSVAIFVDSPDHTSGVATTIRQWSQMAQQMGRDLRIYYCGDQDLLPSAFRFPAVGNLHLGCYQGLVLRMPSVSDVLRHFLADPTDVVHLSTPGPMGLIGLVAARRAGAGVYGTFHTDFPAYAVNLTGNAQVERTAWRFMRWFYGQFRRIAAPSRDTLEKLAAHGLRTERLAVVGRGIRPDRFSPEFRDPALRASWNPDVKQWLLYVGRVSKEKNLGCLAEAFRLMHARNPDIGLVVTGDGPHLEELRSTLAGLPVVFTGVRKDEALARVYASADLFLFPSRTDTLGVVLLEAQASGLPALVSSEGGPKDCILPGTTGEIVEPMNPTLLSRAAEAILSDPARLARMGAAARRHGMRHTPERSFAEFWALHDEVREAGRRAAPRAHAEAMT